MAENSKVKKIAGMITIMLFKKYWPIIALLKARTKLSRINLAGGCQGLKNISLSVLNELKITHSIGKITTNDQKPRKI
jgi:hypothetical protein